MVRTSKATMPFSSRPISRHRGHRFVPSIPGAASCLEERVLLSVAAHKAEVARPLADTPVGREVTSLFESIAHTAPSSQQLTQWVDKLRDGVSAKVLRKDLTAQAKVQAAAATTAAAISNDPVISGPSATTGTSSATAGTTSAAALPAGLLGSTTAIQPVIYTTGRITQVPPGMTISRTYTFPSPTTASTSTASSTTTTSTAATAVTSTTANNLVSLLDTILNEVNSAGPTPESTSATTTAVSEVDTLLSNGALTGIAATASPAVTSAINSLLSDNNLGGNFGASSSSTAVTPLRTALQADGVLNGDTPVTINATTLPVIVGAILQFALPQITSAATSTAATTTSTSSPLGSLVSSGSVATP